MLIKTLCLNQAKGKNRMIGKFQIYYQDKKTGKRKKKGFDSEEDAVEVASI
jgi:hypothetical protein